LDDLADPQRVAERLAHLLAVQRDPGVVQPVVGEAETGCARLGELVLVVREAQVDAAAVDVEGVAEVLAGHRRALEVPARAAGAEGGRPRRRRRLVGLVALPQREVAGVALAARVGVLGVDHVVDLLVGQGAVVGPAAHVEVDVTAAVGGGVGVAALDQGGHQLDHLGHVPGRAGLVGRGQHPERRERLEVSSSLR
jgi:hypothetical protein